MKIADKTNVQRKKKKLAKRLAASFNDTSGFIIYFDFKYMPLGGITIAFKEFLPGKEFGDLRGWIRKF